MSRRRTGPSTARTTRAALRVHPAGAAVHHTQKGPRGRTRFVTEGVGRCRREGGPIEESGSPVTWGEHVTGEQYRGEA